jgi:hypothetical protein
MRIDHLGANALVHPEPGERHRSVVHAGTRGENLHGAEKFAWVIGRNYRSIKKAGRGTRLSSLELSSFLVVLR